MTNTSMLRKAIEESGYRLRWIAKQIGISYQCLINKIENKSEFKAVEISTLASLLRLSDSQAKSIFFAHCVDK